VHKSTSQALKEHKKTRSEERVLGDLEN